MMPHSGESGGRRPKLRSLDGECSTVDEKKGTKNDAMDQKEALRKLKDFAIGEYNALRKPAITIVVVETQVSPQPALTDLY